MHDEITVIVCPTDRHWWYDGWCRYNCIGRCCPAVSKYDFDGKWEPLPEVASTSSFRGCVKPWGILILGGHPLQDYFNQLWHVLRTSWGFLVHPHLLIILQNRVSMFIIAPLRTSFVLVYLLLYTATTGKEMRQCREEKHASTIPTICLLEFQRYHTSLCSNANHIEKI